MNAQRTIIAIVAAAIASVLLIQTHVSLFTSASAVTNCLGSTSTIEGTNGNNVIVGTTGNDVIDAKNGNDIVYGMGGDDKICGRDGNDVIYGGEGADSIAAGNGHDEVYGDSGKDVIDGNGGHDILSGALQNHGWLIKKTNESQVGRIGFASSENSTVVHAPQLVLSFQ